MFSINLYKNQKNQSILNKFIISWLEIKEYTKIDSNLKILKNCILQDVNCIQYFINQNVPKQLIEICNEKRYIKNLIFTFLSDVYEIVSVDLKSNKSITSSFKILFRQKDPLVLPCAVKITESILFHNALLNIYVKNHSEILDFLFEFLFNPRSQGELSYQGLLNLISLDTNIVINYCYKKRLLDIFVDKLNNLFSNLNVTYDKKESDFYNSILSLFCLFVQRLKRYKNDLDIASKLNFQRCSSLESTYKYFNDIVKTQNDINIVSKLVTTVFSPLYVTQLAKNSNLRNIILDLYNEIICNYPYISINYFTETKYKKPSSTDLFQRLSDIHNKTGPKELSTKYININKKLQCRYIIQSNRNFIKMNGMNILEKLILNNIYDFHLYSCIFLISKTCFLESFEHLDKLLQRIGKEEDLLKMWHYLEL
ncbi:hypothetical protein EDEG_03674 [Edhazardia aedis USNM 41457]|uniref:Uncharacterized protein n=1 Tax=Edhazardia aedis (strain USNM 41457) TaxID=1003232 RepID=J9DGW2_EDHAE|nr:hypothetical protein EDEG_03674 [Edhazardia aedis USNM 41457]|eukprot:EJW01845.1 hypothetical protein EDEG_03674 [Edhazardia aedis USNM 41457]